MDMEQELPNIITHARHVELNSYTGYIYWCTRDADAIPPLGIATNWKKTAAEAVAALKEREAAAKPEPMEPAPFIVTCSSPDGWKRHLAFRCDKNLPLCSAPGWHRTEDEAVAYLTEREAKGIVRRNASINWIRSPEDAAEIASLREQLAAALTEKGAAFAEAVRARSRLVAVEAQRDVALAEIARRDAKAAERHAEQGCSMGRPEPGAGLTVTAGGDHRLGAWK